MQVLTPRVDLAVFFASVAQAPARVLMLDYDGTLAPFHIRPDQAVPYPEVIPVLEDIVRAGGTRLVIVSGRPADELLPLITLSERPEIWGSHGWERLLPDGRRIAEQPDREARGALAAANAAIRGVMPAEARLERKLASIALHWRGLPALTAGKLKVDAARVWEPIIRESALEILAFDGGLELRVAGCNKQYAVKTVLSETAQDSAVAYLGDDLTDEDAFRAIKQRGLGVLVRPEFRETQADVWIRPPEELVSFMRHWCVKQR